MTFNRKTLIVGLSVSGGFCGKLGGEGVSGEGGFGLVSIVGFVLFVLREA